MKRKRSLATAVGTAVLAMGAINLQAPTVDAADHTDGAVSTDAAADIGDLYVWEDDVGNIIAVITFANFLAPGDDPVYDEGVLYTLNIDNTADPDVASDFENNTNDNEADIQIHARFGQNGNGDWGVQVLNLPGADGELVGPVGTDIGSAGARVTAGLFDDPFFFDQEGFNMTAANLQDGPPEDLAFAGLTGEPVDAVANSNCMALVMEFSGTEAVGDNADNFLQLWAATGRIAR